MDIFVGRRHVVLWLVFLLTALGWTIEIPRASADSVIYIRADGRIDPATANLTTADNVTYTFTDHNYAPIVVERSHITVDGQGYILQGADEEGDSGVYWNGTSHVTVRNMTISRFWHGVYVANSSHNVLCRNHITSCRYLLYLDSSSHNTISGNTLNSDGYSYGLYGQHSSDNTISGNDISCGWRSVGLSLHHSNNNLISGNNITANGYGGVTIGGNNNTVAGNTIAANYEWCGIELLWGNDNNLRGNTITHHSRGIYIPEDSANTTVNENTIANNYGVGVSLGSSSNTIYHNNFIGNGRQVDSFNLTNMWDDDYPSGGNYWSDYNGTDGNGDGIGNIPYVIDVANQDRYPLMYPWNGSVVRSTHFHLEPRDCVLTFLRPFTVNVTLVNVTDLYGYEFRVRWNATLFDLVAVSVTPPAVWGSNYLVIKSNVSDGVYWHALSALAPAPAFNGSALLLSLTFNVTAAAVGPAWYNRTVATAMTLEDTLLADSAAQAIVHDTRDCSVELRLVILGDLNGDRVVNILDVVTVAIRYGQSGMPGWILEDLDRDGAITIFDIVLLATNYGTRV
jgi:parallel beta-helix repeat protein